MCVFCGDLVGSLGMFLLILGVVREFEMWYRLVL